jgi:hypothetical protein
VQVTLTIPDELAARLRPLEGRLPQILEVGMREWNASPSAYEGLSGVLETLARLPTPEEVLALRPSAALQARIESLLEKNRTTGLLDEERQEWQRYEYLEHVVRIAKARAALKLSKQ